MHFKTVMLSAIVGAALVLAAACAPVPPDVATAVSEVTPPSVDGTSLPPEAVLEAQRWLAEQLNVGIEQVTIGPLEQVEWPDACLGLPQPGEACAEVITPGWRVSLTANGQTFEVRTDETGSIIRLAAQDALTGTAWQLQGYGPDGSTPVAEGSTVTLQFMPGGLAGGSGGCNEYGGTYAVRDSTVSFSNVVSTLRACEDQAVTDQETAFLGALQSTGEFEMAGDELRINYGEGVLVFTRLPEGVG